MNWTPIGVVVEIANQSDRLEHGPPWFVVFGPEAAKCLGEDFRLAWALRRPGTLAEFLEFCSIGFVVADISRPLLVYDWPNFPRRHAKDRRESL